MAWGIQLDGKPNLVVTTVGDAATRQGDFFEAICFAKEKKLPVLFVVEDNAYGISMPTRKINPLAINVLQPERLAADRRSRCPTGLRRASEAFEKIRAGERSGLFLGENGTALQPHQFRRSKALPNARKNCESLEKCDPLKCWKEQLIERRRDYRRRICRHGQRSEGTNPPGILATAEKAEDPIAERNFSRM